MDLQPRRVGKSAVVTLDAFDKYDLANLTDTFTSWNT